jgi:hypothetical protein
MVCEPGDVSLGYDVFVCPKCSTKFLIHQLAPTSGTGYGGVPVEIGAALSLGTRAAPMLLLLQSSRSSILRDCAGGIV